MQSVKIDVLDIGWVEFQEMMGSDLSITNAARTSYLGESKGADKDRKLLFYLMENEHMSPFEMVEFKFRIFAPEVVWRQLLRHRTGNYNLSSFRYTEADETATYMPKEWRLQSATNKQGSEGVLNSKDAEELTQEMEKLYEQCFALYQKALDLDVAREMARLALPGFAVYSTGIVKFDLRNLLHFIKLRTDPHAQWEIQQYALIMRDIVKEKCPWTYEAAIKYGRI